jgi:DNA repair protein RadC
MKKIGNQYSIKNLAVEDRPREKMLLKGRNTLSDAELLAILIRSGNRNESALLLAQKILQDVRNDLRDLGKLTVSQLTKYPGIGEAKAITITAALELGRRRRESDVKIAQSITSSKETFEYMQSVLSDLNHEEFWIILLNVRSQIIRRHLIAEGGITMTTVDVKKIMKLAVEHSAVSMIICHNHPSGNISPSNSDIQLTQRIKTASQIMDISLLDHVIIGHENYYSFADHGNII